MEELLKEGIKFEDGANDKTPVTKYGKRVLRAVIGDERANKVLQSMSMQVIPNVGGGSMAEGLADGKLFF